MKTNRHLPVVLILLLAAASQCLAFVSIEEMTPARAKELGVTVRTKLVGTNVYVWLEFATTGELKNFQHAQLELTGERSLTATLQPDRSDPDRVEVFFAADPSTVTTCTVTLVTNGGDRELVGYRFKMKDFVEPKKPR